MGEMVKVPKSMLNNIVFVLLFYLDEDDAMDIFKKWLENKDLEHDFVNLLYGSLKRR